VFTAVFSLSSIILVRTLQGIDRNYIMAYIFSWSLWNLQSSKNVWKKCYTCYIFGYIFL